MLTRVHVESFKSLENITVELGLVNVFIGANGSGKSNLLEAIGVLGAAASGRVDDEALLRRGVRPGLPALYKTSFQGSTHPKHIRFEAECGRARYAVGLLNPLLNPEPVWRYKTELLRLDDTKIVGRSPSSAEAPDTTRGLAALHAVSLPEANDAGRLLRELEAFAIYSPNTATLRGLDTDQQSRDPIGLNGGRLAEAVLDLQKSLSRNGNAEALEHTLDMIDWAESFNSVHPADVPVSKSIPQPTRILSFRDRYMSRSRNLLSGYDASEGALYVLFMMVLAHHPKAPPVLAVDNFDHALNPLLAKALSRRICEWTLAHGDRQMLLTSHSPLVLDGLDLLDDRIRLFTVERSMKGKTAVTRVHIDAALIRRAKKGVPLSQLWLTGALGGIPRI